MSMTIKCPDCKGTGHHDCKVCNGTGKTVCGTCEGSGKAFTKCTRCTDGYLIDPDDDERVICPVCHGEKRIRSEASCGDCGGSGSVHCANCEDGQVSCEHCGGSGLLPVQAVLDDLDVFDRESGAVDANKRDAYNAQAELIELAKQGNADAAWILAKDSSGSAEEGGGERFNDQYLERAVELGSVFALSKLGEREICAGNRAGLEKCIAAAEKGNASAHGMLAVVYHVGLVGETRDDKKALGYCETANRCGRIPADSPLHTFVYRFPRAMSKGECADLLILYSAISNVCKDAGRDIKAEWLIKFAECDGVMTKTLESALDELKELARQGSVVAQNYIDAGNSAYLDAHNEYLSCKKSKRTLTNAAIEKYEEAISAGNCNAINEFAEILSEDKGRLPNGCFGDDVEMMDIFATVLSELSSKVSGLSFVQRKKESEETAKALIESRNPFRSTEPKTEKEESPNAKKKVRSNAKKEETKTVVKETRGSSQQKKRWMFVVLGLLLGWMGAHYIYAKRWGLFSLHVAAFIGLLIAPPLGLLWLATWFGGTFFVKKDGKKMLMV